MTGPTPASSEPLEVHVGQRLRERGWTIATAESSTGGLIAARLTDVSGSSAYMIGGIVAYADSTKQHMLGIPVSIFTDYGAVSEPVARQMAESARQLFQTNCALSVTGIAGPTGATATKPVGLHYVGLSTADGTWVRRYVWDGTRSQNRHAAADAAFILLLDYLDGKL
jgi:PncC family amidohydrolase